MQQDAEKFTKLISSEHEDKPKPIVSNVNVLNSRNTSKQVGF